MNVNIKSFTRTLIFVFLFVTLDVARAEVFSLTPFSKQSAAGIEASKAFGGVKLWAEPIVVNGLKTGMQLTLLDRGFDELVIFFKKKYPNAVFRASKDAILIEIKNKNGSMERLYLVRSTGAYPVIQFSMLLPDGLPKDITWPNELPIPPSSSPKSTILLPERNLVYGSFTTLIPKQAALSSLTSKLISDGWQDFQQGVFIKKQPFSITLISLSDDEDGKTIGFILTRKLGK